MNEPRSCRLGRILAVIVAAFGLLTACSNEGDYQGDAFTAFVPTRDVFPEAPVAGADVKTGYLVPGDVGPCPVWYEGVRSGVRGDWNGIRYDWTENGHASSWAISTRVTGFADVSPTDVQSAFYEKNVGCVRGYTDYPDISMSWLDLDGLPEGSLAFELISDQGGERPLRLYGAFVVVGAVDRAIEPDGSPGSDDATGTWAAKFTNGPTHALTVAWLAWDTDVPPDQFVATVNALRTAATTN